MVRHRRRAGEQAALAGGDAGRGFRRLHAALSAASDLRDSGAAFVVAAEPARDGEPVVRVGGQFGVAVYPFVEGQSFGWAEFSSPATGRPCSA